MSDVHGMIRSASTLDSWHLAQKFSSRPLLNNAFINEDPPIARVSAVNTSLTNQSIFLWWIEELYIILKANFPTLTSAELDLS